MTLKEKLTECSRLKMWLDAFRPLDADIIGEMKKYYDVKFTYNSNAIEGNTLTQSETEIVLEKGITIGGKTLKEHLEVVGHKNAIDYIEELAVSGTYIGEREIKEIHNIIMREIDRKEAGRYRTLNVRAAGTDHVYPPNYMVRELMEDFVKWMNSDGAKSLHPLKYAGEVHYRLVSVHPFRDGNGRTARLIMNLMLIRNGYVTAVIPFAKRKDYIDSLFYAQNRQGDISLFTEILADSEKESLTDYLSMIFSRPENLRKKTCYDREAELFLRRNDSFC
ncbi:MAG: Fic family protein [Desulfobacterales bacterium]|nr:Fic family protein [Desulfobacterales bacterium]